MEPFWCKGSLQMAMAETHNLLQKPAGNKSYAMQPTYMRAYSGGRSWGRLVCGNLHPRKPESTQNFTLAKRTGTWKHIYMFMCR